MIKPWDTLPTEVVLACDVAIVGGGAGGATIAAALAEGGKRVVLLEEGGHYTPVDFKHRAGPAMRQIYVERGGRVMTGSGVIPLPGGRGLGGSTLINSAICFRAPRRIFDKWVSEAGVDGIGPSAVDAWYREVEATIGVTVTRPEIGRKHNEIFALGAERRGLEAGWMPRNAPGCVGCGSCELGCPAGGKNSADRTFLPRALVAGADVLTGCKVERFMRRGDAVVGISGLIHDPDTREPKGRFRVDAARVILSAGSIYTPILLQQNGLGGAHVGQHLTAHPAGWTAGIFAEVVNFWNGVPQGYYAELEAGAGVLLETASVPPEFMTALLPGVGEALAAWLPRLKHLALAGGMIEDSESAGYVQPGLMGPAITYKMGKADVLKIRRGILEVAKVYEAAGAEELVLGLAKPRSVRTGAEAEALVADKVRPEDYRLYASHPMGTCRMGVDPARSVVDLDGRVHGVPGLYVADASIFPTPLGVNPQMTVMLMALRIAERVLANPS